MNDRQRRNQFQWSEEIFNLLAPPAWTEDLRTIVESNRVTSVPQLALLWSTLPEVGRKAFRAALNSTSWASWALLHTRSLDSANSNLPFLQHNQHVRRYVDPKFSGNTFSDLTAEPVYHHYSCKMMNCQGSLHDETFRWSPEFILWVGTTFFECEGLWGEAAKHLREYGRRFKEQRWSPRKARQCDVRIPQDFWDNTSCTEVFWLFRNKDQIEAGVDVMLFSLLDPCKLCFEALCHLRETYKCSIRFVSCKNYFSKVKPSPLANMRCAMREMRFNEHDQALVCEVDP